MERAFGREKERRRKIKGKWNRSGIFFLRDFVQNGATTGEITGIYRDVDVKSRNAEVRWCEMGGHVATDTLLGWVYDSGSFLNISSEIVVGFRGRLLILWNFKDGSEDCFNCRPLKKKVHSTDKDGVFWDRKGDIFFYWGKEKIILGGVQTPRCGLPTKINNFTWCRNVSKFFWEIKNVEVLKS